MGPLHVFRLALQHAWRSHEDGEHVMGEPPEVHVGLSVWFPGIFPIRLVPIDNL